MNVCTKFYANPSNVETFYTLQILTSWRHLSKSSKKKKKRNDVLINQSDSCQTSSLLEEVNVCMSFVEIFHSGPKRCKEWVFCVCESGKILKCWNTVCVESLMSSTSILKWQISSLCLLVLNLIDDHCGANDWREVKWIGFIWLLPEAPSDEVTHDEINKH